MNKKLRDLLVTWRKSWPGLALSKLSGRRNEGNQLPEVGMERAHSRIKAALLTLERLNVPFRGPFETPMGERIVLIGECILKQAEVVRLHESGKLDGDNIRRLLADLSRNQRIAQEERELMTNEIPKDRRRSQRVSIQIAVIVRTEAQGHEHAEVQAFTSEVSAHGGRLELPLKLTTNQKITLVSPHIGSEMSCRVVRVDGSTKTCSTIAFEFSQCSPQFWLISFVPKDWGPMEKVGNDIQ